VSGPARANLSPIPRLGGVSCFEVAILHLPDNDRSGSRRSSLAYWKRTRMRAGVSPWD